MLKLTYCLMRRPDMSRAEFQHYWRTNHAPLVQAAKDALGIRRYIQSHTMDSAIGAATSEGRGVPHGDGEDFDGVAELWFDSEEALAKTLATPEAARHGAILMEDEAKFIDFARSRSFMVREHEIIG